MPSATRTPAGQEFAERVRRMAERGVGARAVDDGADREEIGMLGRAGSCHGR